MNARSMFRYKSHDAPPAATTQDDAMPMRYLLSAILIFAPHLAVSGQEEKLKEIKGAIRQLDLKTGALTLQLASSDKQMALSLAAKDLPVTNPLGEKLKLTDLRAELRVSAKIRGEDEVVALKIDGPYLYGIVKKVDVAARTVTFKKVFGDRTITVPAQAKFMLTGEEGKINDLKIGGAVQVLFSLDRKSILQVQAGKGINARDPYLRITRYYGILVDVDQPKRQVQVFVQSTDAGAIKAYDVSPDAYLRLQYHLKPIGEVGFDQFAKWVKIYYYVDRDTGRIVNMDADLPVMTRRKVLKVEPGTITVEDELKEKTLPLAADVKVLTPRGEGKLAEVAANRIVNCGLSLDRSRVQIIYLWDK